MSKEKEVKMKTKHKIYATLLGLVLVFGGGALFLNGLYDSAGKKEVQIIAIDEEMQNVFAMTGNDLKTSGITLKHYSETFIKTIKANADRYKNDQGAMMKWVQESKSQMSPDLHRDFMKKITSIYIKKQDVQTAKISIVQEYRKYIHFTIAGKITKLVFTYPTKKALEIMDRLITNKKTKETWKTGNDEVDEDMLN